MSRIFFFVKTYGREIEFLFSSKFPPFFPDVPIFTSALDGNWAWENPGKKERGGGITMLLRCNRRQGEVQDAKGGKGGKKKDLEEEVRIESPLFFPASPPTPLRTRCQ